MPYLWVKALHVVSMVAWMAGMLYLPRLFVYHVEAGAGSPQAKTFAVMEQRLLRLIMNPAMVVVWLTGLWLVYAGEHWREGWLHAKVTLVLVMTGVHGLLAGSRRRLATGTDRRSARFYRILNEGPTLLLIGIVVLVIVKPF